PSDKAVNEMIFRTEDEKMKKRFTKRRVAVLSAVCCLLIASASYAANGMISYIGSSPSQPQCIDFDDLAKVTDKLGYDVNVPDELSGGYEFASATLGDFRAEQDGSVLTKGKELSVEYASESGDKVNLSIIPKAPSDESASSGDVKNVAGVNVEYTEESAKYVPQDYEKTDEDRAKESAGNFTVNYWGEDYVLETEYMFTTFEMGDARYQVWTENKGNVSKSELLDMAKDVISAK
ncbi:MAG: hypothetical protein IJV66_01955, partial [Firmicutes bacterium]|nr:hypothetical protein [Bacillota bacterium]